MEGAADRDDGDGAQSAPPNLRQLVLDANVLNEEMPLHFESSPEGNAHMLQHVYVCTFVLNNNIVCVGVV